MANSAQLRNEIAAGKWDDKLRALYGDAAQEICRQRARYCAALEQFELYFGPVSYTHLTLPTNSRV